MTVQAEVIVDKTSYLKNLGISHYIAIFLWLGWLGIIPLLCVAVVVLYFYHMVGFTILLGLLLISTFYPIDKEFQPKWGYELGDWVMKHATEYFGMRVVMVDKKALEACAPAIFVLEPHDVLPVSICTYSDSLGYFKGHSVRGCVTGVCFAIPFMRQIYTWAGAFSVEKKSLQMLIEAGKSPIVCPGGAQECIYLENMNETNLFLKNRFGLIKLAFSYGIPIVPSFTFGQRSTYDFWVPQNKTLHMIGRKIGFIPLVFFGALGIPMFIPKSKQMTVVVGAPIPVPKVADPTTQQLEEYHAKLITAYEDIFAMYKNEYGNSAMTLKII